MQNGDPESTEFEGDITDTARTTDNQRRAHTRLLSHPLLRSLRVQLILRTLLPLVLLVGAFALAGQVAYTQVSEALAKSRNAEVARVQAARMGDHMMSAVQAVQNVAEDPVLLTTEPARIYYSLRSEPVSQHFDLIQVSDAEGRIIAASTIDRSGTLLNTSAFLRLKGGHIHLPVIIEHTRMRDGTEALVVTVEYIGTRGEFGGVVEGVLFLGSPKLGRPLSEAATAPAGVPATSSGMLSYLVAGDGIILWHPDPTMIGRSSIVASLVDARNAALNSGDTAPAPVYGAIVTAVDGEQSILGYAPVSLGRLLPRAAIEANWVQWYVVTQDKWANVVAPVRALLYALLVLALLTILAAVVSVAHSAATLTRPVAQLVSAARALSEGRLRHRLKVQGPAEIEELAKQFNSMAAQIETSYAQLESKVAERTRELASANAELERRLVESMTMQVVAANLAGSAGLDEILQTITHSVSDALDTEATAVFLPCEDNERELETAAVCNFPALPRGSRLPVDNSITGLAYKTGQAQISLRATEDPRDFKFSADQANARSVLAAPLISRGHTIGVITTINKKSGDFTESDQALMTLLANQAAVAVERARLYSDAQRQLKTLETINELALSVTVSRTIEETLAEGMAHIG